MERTRSTLAKSGGQCRIRPADHESAEYPDRPPGGRDRHRYTPPQGVERAEPSDTGSNSGEAALLLAPTAGAGEEAVRGERDHDDRGPRRSFASAAARVPSNRRGDLTADVSRNRSIHVLRRLARIGLPGSPGHAAPRAGGSLGRAAAHGSSRDCRASSLAGRSAHEDEKVRRVAGATERGGARPTDEPGDALRSQPRSPIARGERGGDLEAGRAEGRPISGLGSRTALRPPPLRRFRGALEDEARIATKRDAAHGRRAQERDVRAAGDS